MWKAFCTTSENFIGSKLAKVLTMLVASLLTEIKKLLVVVVDNFQVESKEQRNAVLEAQHIEEGQEMRLFLKLLDIHFNKS